MGRSSRRGWILGVIVLALAAGAAFAQLQTLMSSNEAAMPGSGGVVGSALGGLADAPGPPPPPQAPVRVGSSIKNPVKVLDVPAVLPETARRAGVSGTVLVEVTVGSEGLVKDAKVLRSIPLLDAAALAAVRQWRYEPTLLNGVPVAVITTAAVQVR
jgi:TonB family protein